MIYRISIAPIAVRNTRQSTVNIFLLHFHICISAALCSFWTWKKRGVMLSNRFHDNKQAGGGKASLIALQSFGIACASLATTWEIYAISAPTNGNASAGICSFLSYQKQSTMRHKYKWNQLCQPWTTYYKTPRKCISRELFLFPSQVKQTEAVGIIGLPSDTNHKASYDTLS